MGSTFSARRYTLNRKHPLSQTFNHKTGRPNASPELAPDTLKLNVDLPVELWQHIFLLFYASLEDPEWHYGRSRQDPIPLTHVCKMWRAVALGTTILWTNIDMTRPRLIPMFLQRSGKSPLRIRYIRWNIDMTRGILSSDEIQQVWQQVLVLSSRICCLEISALQNYYAEEIPPIMSLLKNTQLSWTKLNTVKLNTAEEVNDLPFLSDNPVPLRHLAFGQTAVYADLPVLGQHLSHLSFWGINVPVDGLHFALQRCTQLEVLTLDSLRVSTVQGVQTSRIMLSSLKQLRILGVIEPNSNVLLETLEIPTTASSHLYLFYPHGLPFRIDDLVPPHHHVLTRIRQSPCQVLQLTSHETILSSGATPVQFLSWFRFQAPSDVDVIWVSHGDSPKKLDSPEAYFCSLASSDCRDLTVILDHKQWVPKKILPIQWRGFLARYPNLEKLRTRDFGTDPGYFHMLTKPLQALMVQNKGGFVLPQLRVFTTEYYGPLRELGGEWDKVAKVLRKLCERGRKLQELRLVALTYYKGSFTEEDKEMLEGVLGPHVGKLTLCSSPNY